MFQRSFRSRTVLLALSAFLTAAASPERRAASSVAMEAIGPEGGEIYGLAYHPADTKTIYAAVGTWPSTIFKTRDGGRLWSKVSRIDDRIWDLAVDPRHPRIIYALGDGHLYKSETGAEETAGPTGTSCWTSYSLGRGRSGYLGKVFVHPSNSKTLYASGNFDYRANPFREAIAFFKSVDGGMTWKTRIVSKNSYYGDTLSFAMSPSDPETLYLSGYYGIAPHTANYGIFKSTDAGENWRQLPWNAGDAPYSIAVHPRHSGRIWVATGASVLRSQDGGSTWKPVTVIFDAGDLAVDRSNPDILYAGANFGNYVSKSTDAGVTWTGTFGVYGECLKMLVIDKGPNPGQTVFFGSLGGIFRSLNAGVSWAAANSGLRNTVISAVVAAPSAPVILYAQARYLGMFKSPDAGKTWERLREISHCSGFMKIAVHPSNAKDIVVLSGG